MSDLPSTLGTALFVVGPRERPKWLVLMCPCGCGQRLDANLSPRRYPHWTISIRRGKLTAYPSLAVESRECGCHFWLRDSNVYLASYVTDSRNTSPRRIS